MEKTSDKGPNDLGQLLDQRNEEIAALTKQKEYMQKKCREAGEAIIKLQGKYISLEKEYDKVCEERDNFERMLKADNDVR